MSKNREQKKENTELQRANGAKSEGLVSPFGFMRRFAEEMEHLFDEVGGVRFPRMFGREQGSGGEGMLRADWAPKIEVLRHNGDMTVRAELPGLTKEDVTVELAEDALAISGERKEEKEEKRDGYYRTERSYGSFYRRIPLPEGVNLNQVKANFKDGLLEVTMPVAKREPTARRIEIHTPEQSTATAA